MGVIPTARELGSQAVGSGRPPAAAYAASHAAFELKKNEYQRSFVMAVGIIAFVLAIAGMAAPAGAQSLFSSFSGKLLLTGGVNTVEGSAGGGLTPWAVTGGYGSATQIGGNVYATTVNTTDYRITSYGGVISAFDRVELSLSKQSFDTQKVGGALGLGDGFTIDQTTAGIKVRLIGDAVLDQDEWWPQVAAGAQFKSNDKGWLVKALGARDDKGTDYYISATKLLLAQGVLLNATVRETKANQYGILGFGGIDNRYHTQIEGSAAYLVNRHIAIGAEVRTKPDDLAVAHEGTAYDAFVAIAPCKSFSVTLAWVDLGNIVTRRQTGVYASLQAGF
jgi:hypothetical protein